jgi:heme/copper-type cytochrome/quinol oxidase subunit 4
MLRESSSKTHVALWYGVVGFAVFVILTLVVFLFPAIKDLLTP